MATKRLQRRKICSRKVRHDTENHAAAAAIKLRLQGEKLSWYSCRFCSGWHTGHPNRRMIQSIRAQARNQRLYQAATYL